MRRILGVLIAPAVAAVALLCSACSDGSSPVPLRDRWVYYSVDSADADREHPQGLCRIAMSDGGVERIDARSVVAVSGVAANGILVFQQGTGTRSYGGAAQMLFGRCENGSVIPVPFPVFPRVDSEYVYALPPAATVGYNGHHAIYPVHLKPAASTASDRMQPRLVLFNCARGEMTMIDVLAGARSLHPGDSIVTAAMSGDNLILSDDGAKAWFTAGTSMASGTWSYRLYEWSGTLREIGSPFDTPISIAGYDDSEGYVIVLAGTRCVRIAVSDGGATELSLPSVMLAPKQFSRGRGEFVILGTDGIELRDAGNPVSVKTVMTYRDLDAVFRRSYDPGQSQLVVSPDGEWLVFAADITPGADVLHLRDILVLRRDGSDLRRLATGVRAGDVSISDQIQRN
jgi:hypothetical protein